MSWRTVIISSAAKLDYQMGYLVIRKDDVTKIHLSEIENSNDRIHIGVADRGPLM